MHIEQTGVDFLFGGVTILTNAGHIRGKDCKLLDCSSFSYGYARRTHDSQRDPTITSSTKAEPLQRNRPVRRSHDHIDTLHGVSRVISRIQLELTWG